MTTNYGYIDSEDSTTAHNATQWGKAANGTGLTFAAWPNSGAILVGSSGHAVDGFFPNGTYAAYVGYLEFDTTSISAPLDATLTLTVNANNGQTWNLNVAAHDWGGGSVTTGDWLDPTALSALTVAGTVTSAAVNAAFGGAGTIDIAIDAAAINAGGMTRLVLYSSTHASNTPPADTVGAFNFDPVVAGDLVVTDGAEVFIRKISHQITVNGPWTTTFEFESAGRFAFAGGVTYFTIGSSSVGGTDILGY